MFYGKKKVSRENRCAAWAIAALLLAGMLSGCGGNGQDTAGGKESMESSSARTESRGAESDAASASGEEARETGVIFEAQDIEGNAVTSDIFGQSRLTMVNVWATYCNPCLSEMPELGELAGEYDPGDFRLIGIVSDVPEAMEGIDEEKAERAREEAKSLIEKTGADYTHLLLGASLYNALLTDVTAVPTTFFIDKEGNVLDQVVGAMDKDSWKEKIDALLEDL